MRRILIPLLVGSALLGQTATIIMRNPEKDPESVVQLAKSLRREPRAAWLLLEGTQGEWLGSFRALLNADEELLTVGLPVRTLGAKSPLATELRAQQGWSPAATWVLVGPGGRVLESGQALPSAQQLGEGLAAHGVRGEIRDLEAFVAAHPDHLQAAERLLGQYISLADRRTSRLLKPTPEPAPEDEAPPELQRPLTDEEDARIWGRAATLMNRLLQSGDWRLGLLRGWTARVYRTGRFSPLMQTASRRGLPLVEEALRQAPGHFQIWTLWNQLAENAGGRPLRPLLESLVAVPGEPEAIPEAVFAGYVRSARSRGDWTGIIEVLGPQWDRRKEDQVQVITVGEAAAGRDALKSTWDATLKPLVEAHLRLGATLDADRIVREAAAWMPSNGLPGWSSALAQRCGQPGLAAQWSSLPGARK